MPFQNLPLEILSRIFAGAGSLSDLRAVASTSQRAYSAFLAEKAVLIYRVLSNELGPVLSDAVALSQTGCPDVLSPSYHQQLRDFVSLYGGYLTSQNHPRPYELSLNFVLGLVSSYRTMTYIANVFTTSAGLLFQNDIEPSPSGTPAAAPPLASGNPLAAPPSRTEQLRILRALYRLEILFHLYGHYAHGYRRRYNKRDTECFNYRLFGLWEPWELEQVSSVAGFMQRLHCEFAQLVDDDLRNEAISWRVFYRLGTFRDFIEKLRARDEAVWQRVLRAASTLRSKLRNLSGTYTVQNSMDWFHPRYHDHRMKKFPPGKYGFPTPLRFDGDAITTTPFAWVDAFGGYYGHDFFETHASAKRAHMRLEDQGGATKVGAWYRLGFLMWDEPRVTVLKTVPVLSISFATGWLLSEASDTATAGHS